MFVACACILVQCNRAKQWNGQPIVFFPIICGEKSEPSLTQVFEHVFVIYWRGLGALCYTKSRGFFILGRILMKRVLFLLIFCSLYQHSNGMNVYTNEINPSKKRRHNQISADTVSASFDAIDSLIFFVRRGDATRVKELLAGSADIDERDFSNITVLMHAVRSRQVEIVQLLIGAGVDVNARNRNGITALMYAVRSRQVEMVRLLIDAGANVNAQDYQGMTALMRAAAMSGNGGVIACMLLKAGADLTMHDRYGRTALDRAKKMGGGLARVLEGIMGLLLLSRS